MIGFAKSMRNLKRNRELLLFCVPGLFLLFIFSYLPMAGVLLAFKNYYPSKGFFGSPWVAFENFRFFFTSQDALIVTRNTVLMNSAFIIIGTTVAVCFGLMLFEISKKWTKIYQTILFFPYFTSWVFAAYLLYVFLNTDLGALNRLLVSMGLEEVMKKYKIQRKSNKEIVLDYLLKRLLIDSSSMTDEEFNTIIQENLIPLDLNNGTGVCLLKIDNYRSFIEKYEPKDCKLYKFAIINILNELVSETFPCVSVDMGDDRIVLLFNAGNNPENFIQRLIPALKRTQKTIQENYSISFSCTLNDKTYHLRDITKSFNETLNISKYRFILGNACIIVPENIKGNLDSTKTGYSPLYERNLKESIKSGNLEKVDKYLARIFEEIAEMNANEIMLSTTRLINTYKTIYEEMNATRLITASVNFNFFDTEFIEKETADVLFSMLMNIAAQFSVNENEYKTEKQAIMVQAVKEIIHTNFHDSDLCLQRIASMLKLNHLYVGKVFKIHTQISVNDYINEVRLSKAAELLRNTRLSIQDISLEVGIENQNYFYTLFKKKYGNTPKAFSMNSKFK